MLLLICDPVKVRKRIKELERIYGIEHGGDRKTSSPKVSDLNQEQLDILSSTGFQYVTFCQVLKQYSH